jgi:hypothetical protein
VANRLVAREEFGNLYRQLSMVRELNGEANLDPVALVEGPELQHMLGLARSWANHSQAEVSANQIPVLFVSFLFLLRCC